MLIRKRAVTSNGWQHSATAVWCVRRHWLGYANDSMKSIDEHIKKDQSELEAAKAEGNDAKVRHFSEELESLQDYKKEHPGDSHDPTPLELYCENNPEADECRVYDD